MKHLSALLSAHYRKPPGGLAAIAAHFGRPPESVRALLTGHRESHGRKIPPMWIDGAMAVIEPHVWAPGLDRPEVAGAFLMDVFGDQGADFWADIITAARDLLSRLEETTQ